ncbi:YidB family protein [Devosia sp. A449]
MTALLGLLAVAGYQNRDKIGEFLQRQQAGHTGVGDGSAQPAMGSGQPGGNANNLGGALGDLFSGDSSNPNSLGNVINAGLGSLLETFRANGQGDVADSWVKDGPARRLETDQLAQAIGPETLDDLQKQTGLTRDELLSRLSQNLPDAVDKFTPDSRIPSTEEASKLI